MRRKIVRDSRAEMMRQERRNNRRHRTNYIYQVVIQDEYNNLYHIGFYNNLYNSVDDINEWLKGYGVSIKKDDLHEYPSTMSVCFDLSLCDLFEDNESVSGIMIRGFIFERKELMKELQEKCVAKLGHTKWE